MDWMDSALTTDESKSLQEGRPQDDSEEAWANRRSQERRDVSVEVGLYADFQFYTGMSSNISTGGLFIATDTPLSISSTFDLTFNIPSVDHEFKCKVEVRWVRDLEMASNSGLNAGMGVKFIGLDAMEHKLIDQFISNKDTLFYDDE